MTRIRLDEHDGSHLYFRFKQKIGSQMINLAWIQRSLMAFMVGVSFHSVLLGQAGTKGANSSEPRCVSRVFFQDDVSKTLKWADLFLGQTLTLGKVKEVAGFPKLDPEKQTLVQMESARGYLMVGVRDEEKMASIKVVGS